MQIPRLQRTQPVAKHVRVNQCSQVAERTMTLIIFTTNLQAPRLGPISKSILLTPERMRM